MRYWWVNQNQTHRQEVRGGYLWSPKRKTNAARNPFYDFMREVAPGDAIFSFVEGSIQNLGFATSHAYESPKPAEFGQTGAHWDLIGWRVDVRFHRLAYGMRPAEHIDVLRPRLPHRYAPLDQKGRGLQSVYLTPIPRELAGALVDLLGSEARALIDVHLVTESGPMPNGAAGLVEWEEHEIGLVRNDPHLDETTRRQIVLARRGQGLFRAAVIRNERACRVTGVDVPDHLRASHCKPWRDASNDERLDGDNGLLLTPNVDHLFDRGFIAFDGNGDLLVSPVAHRESLRRLGLDPQRHMNVGRFSQQQARYLDFHRENVFLRSKFIVPEIRGT